MVKAVGVENWRDLVLFIAIVALVAITPLGREATAAPVFIAYRLLLITITLYSIATLKNKLEPEICPLFVASCAAVVVLMLLSVIWNPGSRFDGFYRWYQYLLFGSAFLALATMHRERNFAWKRSVLWAVLSIDVIYLAVSLLIGGRPVLGPFVNANYFASFLLVGFAIGVAIVLFHEKQIIRIVGGACAAFLYYGMTQAWSRGATLAGMGVVALAILRFSQSRGFSRKAIAAILGLALFTGAAASPNLVRKFFDRGQIDPYNYQRPKIWMSALSVIAEHPLLGVGLGEFFHVSKRFSPAVEGTIARYLKRPAIAHSEYLQQAAESGVPSALVLFSLCGYLFYIAWQRTRLCSRELRVVQEAAILTATGLALHALVDNNWTVPVMAAGLVVFSLGDVSPLREWKFPLQWSPRLRVAGGIVLTLLIADAILIPGIAVYSNEAGHAAYDRGDDVRAESLYRLAAAVVPSNGIFLDNAGVVYFDKYIQTKDRRWLDYAEMLFTQAREANPNAEESGRRLETVLIQRLTGDPGRDRPIHLRIVDVDRDILKVDPFNPFVRKNLAEALYNSGQRDAAEQELLKAIQLEPNYVPAYLRYAELLEQAGDRSGSEEYRQRAISVVTRYQSVKTAEPYEAMLLGRPEPHPEKP